MFEAGTGERSMALAVAVEVTLMDWTILTQRRRFAGKNLSQPISFVTARRMQPGVVPLR